MVNVPLIGLRVNWLLSGGSVGWGGAVEEVWRGEAAQQVASSLLFSSVTSGNHPALPLQDTTWPHLSRHSQKKSHNHHPIKKLCIIYHVICQHNQIEYDLLLILGNFHSTSKDRGGTCNLNLSFTLNVILCSLKKKKEKLTYGWTQPLFADVMNATPPEMWW